MYLIAERDCYCRPDFTFIDNELKIDRPAWRIDNELAVNFYMSIDRVDRIDGTKLVEYLFNHGVEHGSESLAYLLVCFERQSVENDRCDFRLLGECAHRV